MNTQKDPRFSPEDHLKAENNLIKLKLGVALQVDDTRSVSSQVENEWLKTIYDFQKRSRNPKRIKLYDYIGRPTFTPWDSLSPHQVHPELQRMELIMENNGVQLDCLCQYDELTIYQFITEELFEHEMDDLRIQGMTCHFTYEAFRSNHDYDLRDLTIRFVKSVFTRPWDEAFDGINLADAITFSGKTHDRRSISSIMRAFQEAHVALSIIKLNIKLVNIGVVNIGAATRAQVSAALAVSGRMKHEATPVRYEGTCTIRFVRSNECWYIEKFHVPGLSQKR